MEGFPAATCALMSTMWRPFAWIWSLPEWSFTPSFSQYREIARLELKPKEARPPVSHHGMTAMMASSGYFDATGCRYRFLVEDVNLQGERVWQWRITRESDGRFTQMGYHDTPNNALAHMRWWLAQGGSPILGERNVASQSGTLEFETRLVFDAVGEPA